MNSQPKYLKVENLSKYFGRFKALHDISISINDGEFVCFLGPSGCGKTTLLRCIAGLELQSSGKIFQNGKLISNLPTSQRDFGIVFQSYALFLISLALKTSRMAFVTRHGRKWISKTGLTACSIWLAFQITLQNIQASCQEESNKGLR